MSTQMHTDGIERRIEQSQVGTIWKNDFSLSTIDKDSAVVDCCYGCNRCNEWHFKSPNYLTHLLGKVISKNISSTSLNELRLQRDLTEDRTLPISHVYSPRLLRAQKLIESHNVKLHFFLPSGRGIWTVVGNEGDLLVDPDPEKPFCSCEDFHYRVMSGKVAECYHLIDENCNEGMPACPSRIL